MDSDINAELGKLKALAEAATPQNFDSAECQSNDGWIECPHCSGDGTVELTADYCNYDGAPIGVQFYGIGDEHGAAEAYYRAANPAAILSLIALVSQQAARIAELEARQRPATDEEVAAWADRHDIANRLGSEARSAFEDAASLHLTFKEGK